MVTTKRLVCVSGLVVGMCALSFLPSGSFRSDAPTVFAADGGASISDVMIVAHSGKMSLLSELKEAVKGGGPSSDKDWKEVRARGAILATLATDVLGKQKPKKGSEDSWKKQVAAYADSAKKLAAAAAQEDLSGVSDEVKALSKSCSGCHKPHK